MMTLWALDLDSGDRAVRAHRIVSAEDDGRGGEVRITACGARLTAWNHDRGWWDVAEGKLPLQSHAIHCGIEVTS